MPSGPLAFWSIAVLMTAGALAFVLPGLLVRRRMSPGRSRRDMNLMLWRQALADLDRDFERGLLPADQFEEARRELLDRAAGDGVGETETTAVAERTERAPKVAALVAIVLPALAFGLYVAVGEPGVMNGDLGQHLADKPADGRGWILLGRREFENNRYLESAAAFERAVTVSHKVANDPAVWCEYADAAGMAQGGRLSGKPAELIARARSFTPLHPCAMEMAGSLAYERADYAAAALHWRQLLATLPANDASHRQLSAAIARAEKLAGKQPGRALLSSR